MSLPSIVVPMVSTWQKLDIPTPSNQAYLGVPLASRSGHERAEQLGLGGQGGRVATYLPGCGCQGPDSPSRSSPGVQVGRRNRRRGLDIIRTDGWCVPALPSLARRARTRTIISQTAQLL